MFDDREEVWITGIGLVSSLGEGCDAHWRSLANGADPQPVLDEMTYAPYPVHPLVEVAFSKQISKRGDLRQMGRWQRLGTYAAGMALADAGISGQPDYLEKTDMIVAAGGGERDANVDSTILEGIDGRNDPDVYLNEALSTQLRPTLFLAQLSNLLAGNISIVHKVTGSSRTFMGEEMAGLAATQVAVRKIAAGQSDLCLVGGAYNAERPDMQLLFEFGHYLWSEAYKPLWERNGKGGGIVTGSAGAFLVLEAKSHALERSAKPYARIYDVLADRCDRSLGGARANAMKQFSQLRGRLQTRPLAVLSGTCGAEPIAGEERRFLKDLESEGFEVAVRATGTMLGHVLEAQFPASLALAAMALSEGHFYAPFDRSGFEAAFSDPPNLILATSWGHWRGEGMALIEAID